LLAAPGTPSSFLPLPHERGKRSAGRRIQMPLARPRASTARSPLGAPLAAIAFASREAKTGIGPRFAARVLPSTVSELLAGGP
jgi:hypothetical protein